jgi:hypothetical protein
LRLKLNVRSTRHSQRISNVATLLCKPPIFLDTQQHMGKLATICDEYGAAFGRLLCAGDILIQLAAGNSGNGHGSTSYRLISIVTTLLHINKKHNPPARLLSSRRLFVKPPPWSIPYQPESRIICTQNDIILNSGQQDPKKPPFFDKLGIAI